MRALVFLLIPINLLFFLWSGQYFRSAPTPDALRLQQQILPDRVRIVSRDEPPPLPVKRTSPPETPVAEAPPAPPLSASPEETPPPKNVCFSMDALQSAELLRVERLLSRRFPAFRAEQTRTSAKSTFWVFIPPLANRPEAERKVNELRQKGVPEFFIVQEGPQRFAISLGIFSSQEAAQERLSQLQEKGVRSALVGERAKQPALFSLTFRGPETHSDQVREALKTIFPKKALLSCASPAIRQ